LEETSFEGNQQLAEEKFENVLGRRSACDRYWEGKKQGAIRYKGGGNDVGLKKVTSPLPTPFVSLVYHQSNVTAMGWTVEQIPSLHIHHYTQAYLIFA